MEDAILQARARQAYRTAGEPADGDEQAADLKRWPAVESKS
ncbi:hypothetical protein ABZU53_04805 [Micromonospora sp. NPDC005194]